VRTQQKKKAQTRRRERGYKIYTNVKVRTQSEMATEEKSEKEKQNRNALLISDPQI